MISSVLALPTTRATNRVSNYSLISAFPCYSTINFPLTAESQDQCYTHTSFQAKVVKDCVVTVDIHAVYSGKANAKGRVRGKRKSVLLDMAGYRVLSVQGVHKCSRRSLKRNIEVVTTRKSDKSEMNFI